MAAFIMLLEYVLVLVSVLADLWSGLRKAKMRGEARRSEALRRTVKKIAQYYNVLLALTVVDLMQMGLVAYVRVACQWDVPLVPIFTVIGAIGIAAIEVKSIFEKSEEKQQRDYREAMKMFASVLQKIQERGVVKLDDLFDNNKGK
jgi:steroid 5-alpha reductase family enzyme